MGVIGRGELGGSWKCATDVLQEVHVDLLPQLRACVLLLASRNHLCLLLHLAGDFVLQILQEIMALGSQMPFSTGEMELWFQVVLFCATVVRICLIYSSKGVLESASAQPFLQTLSIWHGSRIWLPNILIYDMYLFKLNSASRKSVHQTYIFAIYVLLVQFEYKLYKNGKMFGWWMFGSARVG